MVFEQVPIDAQKVAAYSLTIIGDLVKTRIPGKLDPLFHPGDFPNLDDINKKMLTRKADLIRRALDQMGEVIAALDQSADEKKTLHETLSLLNQALNDYPANTNVTLIQALLGNFRNITTLKESREDLAKQLGINLI